MKLREARLRNLSQTTHWQEFEQEPLTDNSLTGTSHRQLVSSSPRARIQRARITGVGWRRPTAASNVRCHCMAREDSLLHMEPQSPPLPLEIIPFTPPQSHVLEARGARTKNTGEGSLTIHSTTLECIACGARKHSLRVVPRPNFQNVIICPNEVIEIPDYVVSPTSLRINPDGRVGRLPRFGKGLLILIVVPLTTSSTRPLHTFVRQQSRHGSECRLAPVTFCHGETRGTHVKLTRKQSCSISERT